MPKLIIPKDALPKINPNTESYFVRFRLNSDNKNTSSYWSPVFEIETSVFHNIVDGSLTYIGDNTISAIWEMITLATEYDIWLFWSPTHSLSVATSINISGISADGKEIVITTATEHGLFAGDIVKIQGTSPSSFSGSTKRVASIISPTKFSIVSNNVDTYVSGGTIKKEDWSYYGRFNTNNTNIFIPAGAIDPSDKTVTVRIFAAPETPGMYENFLIYEYQNFDVPDLLTVDGGSSVG